MDTAMCNSKIYCSPHREARKRKWSQKTNEPLQTESEQKNGRCKPAHFKKYVKCQWSEYIHSKKD